MKQFNTWERYFDTKHPKHEYQVARHDWFMDRVHGPRLLDVGCSGGLALFLAGKNPGITELHGVDVCERTNRLAVERLSCYAGYKTVVIHTAPAESVPVKSGSFDCVICGETLEHVNDVNVAAIELARVTKSGGTLLVSVPKGGHLSREHVRLFTRESLRNLIESVGFSVIEENEMRASSSGFYLLLKALKI